MNNLDSIAFYQANLAFTAVCAKYPMLNLTEWHGGRGFTMMSGGLR